MRTLWVVRTLSAVAVGIAVLWGFNGGDVFEVAGTVVAALIGLVVVETRRQDPEVGAAPELASVAHGVNTLAVAAEASARPSLAVLPLENKGSEEDAYLCEGVTEDVSSRLSRVPSITVISSGSTRGLGDDERTDAEKAEALGVVYLIKGSVRRIDDRVRVTVTLLEASRGEQVWSDRFDRGTSDVLELFDSIAEAVAEALEVHFAPERHTRGINPDAYRLVLQGRYKWDQWTERDLLDSVEMFSKAIEIDPTYAQAHVEMGRAWSTVALGYWSMRPLDAYPRALTSLQRALELDPRHADAHAWRGAGAQFFEYDVAGAKSHYEKALELDPNSALAHDCYSWWLTATGRHEESLEIAERARLLDPLSPFIWINSSLAAYRAREHELAASLCAHVVELHGDLPVAGLGHLPLCELERYEEALALTEMAVANSGGHTAFVAMHGHTLARAGDRDAARVIVDDLEQRRSNENIWLFAVAMIWTALGDHDIAFERLRDSIEERIGWGFWLAVEPALDPLRHDPRFPPLLERVGLAPYF